MAGKKIGTTKGSFSSIKNEIIKSVGQAKEEIKSEIAKEFSDITVDKILADVDVEVDVDAKVKMQQNIKSLIDAQIPSTYKKTVDTEISLKFGKDDSSVDLSELVTLDKSNLKKKISQLLELAQRRNETAAKQLYGAIKIADIQGVEYDKDAVKEYADYVEDVYSDMARDVKSTLSKIDLSSFVKTTEETTTSIAKNTQKQTKIATDSIKKEFVSVKNDIKEYNKEISKMKRPAFHVGDLESNPNYKADSLGSNKPLERIGSGSFWSTNLDDALQTLNDLRESGKEAKLYITDIGNIMDDMVSLNSEEEYDEYVKFLGHFNKQVITIAKMEKPSIKANELNSIYEEGKKFFDQYNITKEKLQVIISDAVKYYKNAPKDSTSDDLSTFLQQKAFNKKGVTTTAIANDLDSYSVGTVVFQDKDLSKIYSIVEKDELEIETIKKIVTDSLLNKAKNENNTVEDLDLLVNNIRSSGLLTENEINTLSNTIKDFYKSIKESSSTSEVGHSSISADYEEVIPTLRKYAELQEEINQAERNNPSTEQQIKKETDAIFKKAESLKELRDIYHTLRNINNDIALYEDPNNYIDTGNGVKSFVGFDKKKTGSGYEDLKLFKKELLELNPILNDVADSTERIGSKDFAMMFGSVFGEETPFTAKAATDIKSLIDMYQELVNVNQKLASVNSDSHLAETLQKYKEDILELNPLLKGVANHTEELVKPVQWQSKYGSYFKKQQEEVEQSSKITITEFKNIISAIDLTSTSFEDLLKLWNDFQQTKFDSNKAREVAAFRQVGDQLKNTFEELGYEFDNTNKTWNKKQFNIEGKSLQELVELYQKLGASGDVTEELDKVKLAILGIVEAGEKLNPLQLQNFSQILTGLNVKPEDVIPIIKEMYTAEQAVSALEKIRDRNKPKEQDSSTVQQTQALKKEEQQAEATAEAERKVNEVREQSSTSTSSATSQVSTSTTTFTSEEIENQKKLISVLEENITKIKNLIDDEITRITELEKEIREGVPAAITEKNNAFEEERNIVSKFTGEEINSIQQLNSIYDNLKGFSELIAPDFDNIIQKLGILSDTLKNISLSDQNLGETARTIRSVAGAIKELQNLDKTNSAMTEATNKAKTMAQALANEFGIKGKSSIEELQNALGHLYSNIGNDTEIGRALNNLDKVIRKYGTVEQEVDETNKTIRDFLKNSTLYISSTDKADWGKDLIKVYGSFGYSNITTNKEKGRDPEQLLRDINALFQDEMLNGEIDDSKGIFDLSKINGTQDALRALIAFLENSKPKVIEFSKAINAIPGVKENLSDKIEKIAESVGTTTKESFDSLFEYMNSMGIYDLKDLPIKKLGNEESGNILEKFIPNLGDVQQVIERFDLLKTAINNVQQAIKDKISQLDEEKKVVLESIPQEIEEFEKLNQKIQEVILTIASKISMIRQERSEVESAVKAELEALKQLLQQPDIDIKIHADVSNIINEIENALKNASFNINVNPNIGINNGSGNNTPPLSSPGQAPSGSGRKNTKQGVWDIVRQYRIDSKGHTYISDTFKNGNESIIQGLNGNVLRKNEKTSTAYTDQVKLQKKLYSDQKAMINEVFKIKKQIYNLDKVENAEEVSELRGQLKDLQSAINVTKRELRNNGVNKSEVDSKYNEVYGKQQQSYDNWEKQQKAQERDKKRQLAIDVRTKKQKELYDDELKNRTELYNIQHKLNMAQVEGTKEFKSMTDSEKQHLELRKQELEAEYKIISRQRSNNSNQELRDSNDKVYSDLKANQQLELKIAKEKADTRAKEKRDQEDALARQKIANEYIKETQESEKAVQEAKIQIEKEYDALVLDSYKKQKDALQEIYNLRKENLKLQVPDGMEQSAIDAKKVADNETRILELGKEIRSSIETRNQLNRDSIAEHKNLVQFQEQLNNEYKEAVIVQEKNNASKQNKEAAKLYKELLKDAREYYELIAKENNNSLTDAENERLIELKEKWDKATQAAEEYRKETNGSSDSIKTYNDAQAEFNNVQALASVQERALLIKDLKKYTNLANSADSKYMGEFAQKIHEVANGLQKISDKGFDFAKPDQAQLLVRILNLKKEIESSQGIESLKKASEETINKLRLKITDFMNKNSGMGKEFMSQFEDLKIKLDGSQSVEEIKTVLNEFIKLENEVTKADKLGKSFFKTIKEHWTSITAQAIAQYFSFQDILRYIRTVADTVTQIDSALTELRKVSDATTTRLKQNFETSADTAKELGRSITDVINSTADWSRAGFSIDEAEQLARVSTLYQNVGENLDATTANEYLVSTLRGFHKTAEDAEHIVDIFNEVANNYSIDTAGIGEALQRSASVFYNSATDIESAVALITGANEIVQDPERIGNAWKTLSARIRASKSELQEMGEETDDMFESTAKLQEYLIQMTGVDILKEDGKSFKDLTTIVIELGKAFEDLDNEFVKQEVAEKLAGKTQMNVLLSAISNYKQIEKARETAYASQGSAMREQENYAKSVQYSIDKMKASLQELQADLISSDSVKWLVEVADSIINMVDKIVSNKNNLVAIFSLITGALATKNNVGGLKNTSPTLCLAA